MASSFASEIIRLHGHPEVIVTDRDPKHILSSGKNSPAPTNTPILSTGYYLQMDGSSEALSKYCEQHFRCSWVTALMNGHLYLALNIGTVQRTRKLPR